MQHDSNVEIVIIGAGIAGIATAYYLATWHRKTSVLLIDPRGPMSYTSAQSGDNYRNWWPHPTMVRFTDHSIDLMEALARQTGNSFNMTRRGYLLATRRAAIDDLLDDLDSGYGEAANTKIRLHKSIASSYCDSLTDDWRAAPDGVDVLSDRHAIRELYPMLAGDIRHLLHIRRAGDIDSQALAAYMLQRFRARGGRLLRGECMAIRQRPGFRLDISTPEGDRVVAAECVVNAAGPFADRVAGMLGDELPLRNVFQQKIMFEDELGAVPRDLPFAIDLDPVTLGWPADIRDLLAQDPGMAWLAGELPRGRHCRPDGAAAGRRVKLGWAYNTNASEPREDLANEPALDGLFPELAIRGAATLLPALARYIDSPPLRYTHYGGYYTMTDENWPVIGPLSAGGAFIVAALSGFGSMAACAAGFTCAAWICGAALPPYAQDLSLARYADPKAIAALGALADRSLL